MTCHLRIGAVKQEAGLTIRFVHLGTMDVTPLTVDPSDPQIFECPFNDAVDPELAPCVFCKVHSSIFSGVIFRLFRRSTQYYFSFNSARQGEGLGYWPFSFPT